MQRMEVLRLRQTNSEPKFAGMKVAADDKGGEIGAACGMGLISSAVAKAAQ